MDREITVAHLKPDGLSQMSHCLQAKECIALHAPASLFAKKSSEYVGDGIEVGRDVQSPLEQAVTGIDNQCQLFGCDVFAKSINELGLSRPTGQHNDHAALLASP